MSSARERYDRTYCSHLQADFVRAMDLHKAEIQRLRELVCECGHALDFDGRYVPTDLHDENCPAVPEWRADDQEQTT